MAVETDGGRRHPLLPAAFWSLFRKWNDTELQVVTQIYRINCMT